MTGRLGPPPGLAGDYQPGGGAGNGASRGQRQLGPGRQRADGGLRAVRRRAPGDRADGGPAGHRADERLVKPGRVHAAGHRAAAVLPARHRCGGRPSAGRAGARHGRLGRADRANRPSQRRRLPGASRRTAAARHPAVRPGRPPARHPTRSAPRPRRARGHGTGDSSERTDGSRTSTVPGVTDVGRPDGPDWRTPDRRDQGRGGSRDSGRVSGGWPAAGRGGQPGADRTRRPSRRRRPADQHRVLTRVGQRLGRAFLPGGRAPFAGPGQADRADAGLQRADRLLVRPAADRAVRVRPDRRVPGAAVRHRGAEPHPPPRAAGSTRPAPPATTRPASTARPACPG